MRLAGILWNLAALFFLASVASAGVISLVRKARARGKRLFVDLPTQRLRGIHTDTRTARTYIRTIQANPTDARIDHPRDAL